ncbi:MAG TPA: hypothetical protein VFX20_02835 [Steroidobacteraceae bacterium]|nr:hypothetical protein [Steroidobacteraceae bacterium]
MTREQFIGNLASVSGGLEIPVHRKGKLLGLPRKFHQALALAYLLDALGQPAPSSRTLRAWYGDETLGSPEAAKWIYAVTGALQDADLETLHPKELNAFGIRLVTLGSMAHAVAADAKRKTRRKRKSPHHDVVNPS